MLTFKGMRFPIDVILVCIRWYLAYPLSYRHLDEMMEERGVSVDHSSINRWTIRFWKYLYRAVDKQGKTVDFLLTAKRDMAAAQRFFDKAMGANGDPNKVSMDESGANKAAIDAINAGRDVPIVVRQVKYLNNIVAQDHRAIKRLNCMRWPARSVLFEGQCAISEKFRRLINNATEPEKARVANFTATLDKMREQLAKLPA